MLPNTLPAPSTSRRLIFPRLTPSSKETNYLLLPDQGVIGRVLAAAAARHPGPTMAHRVDYSHVDTIETRFRDIKRRMMIALEMVNRRVSYQVDVRSKEDCWSSLKTSQIAHKDRRRLIAEIEARVIVLETEVHRHEWQCHAADDLAVQHIMHTQALEAGARIDTLEDTGSSFLWKGEASKAENIARGLIEFTTELMD
ncbi:hypothetical protein Tco_0374787 [Tanacetum coccineum]